MNSIRPELFLSHAAADRDLAEYVELTARSSIPNIDVFRTTRLGGIPTGREWFDEIAKHLRSADLYLVLLTESSMARPWVCFEMGAAWMRGKPLVPVLAGGLTPERVPEPLRLLQLLSLDDPSQASQAFRDLGGDLRDPQGFVERASELAARGRLKTLTERLTGLTFEGDFYAYDGPFHEIPEGDAVPMPEDLPQAFKGQGYEVVLAIPHRPQSTLAQGYKKVWLLDTFGQKRPMLSRREEQQLYAKPPSSPR